MVKKCAGLYYFGSLMLNFLSSWLFAIPAMEKTIR
jgi:hypothetical protein